MAYNEIALRHETPARKLLFDNVVSHFVFENASRLASYGFILGHVGLVIQKGFVPNLEGATGLLWLAAAGAMGFARTHPVAAFRIAGACGISGALLLSASGFNFDTMQITDVYKVMTPLVSYVPANLLMFFQNELPAFDARLSQRKNIFCAVLSKICKLPVATCAALGMIGVTGIATSAFNNGDVNMGLITFIWAVAHVGLMASDPRLQKESQKYRPSSTGF